MVELRSTIADCELRSTIRNRELRSTIGVLTAGPLYRKRHFGRRRLRPVLVNRPLVVVSVLSVLHSGLTMAWLIRWVRHNNTAATD